MKSKRDGKKNEEKKRRSRPTSQPQPPLLPLLRLQASSSSSPSSSVNCRRFEGKVALVTASTAGIGLSIAERLGLEGASLVLCSRRQRNVDGALAFLKSKGITRAVGTAAHVGKEEDIQRLLDLAASSFGANTKIDVLVSNAAVNPFAGSILDTPPEAVDKVLEINLKSAIALCRAVVPKMPTDGSAAVVFVSSITAFRPEAPLGVYAVSKTALVALSRALAEELAPAVRVNCVAPGTVPTKFAAALTDDTGAGGGGGGGSAGGAISPREIAISRTLLGRLGTPEDMAAAVAFLASRDASYVTGECLVVAGGMMASRL